MVNIVRGHVATVRCCVANSGAGSSIWVPYEIVEHRIVDISTCYADASKAERVLGWEAELGIEDMCRDAWRWGKNQH